MIQKNNIDLSARYLGNKVISYVYKGVQLIWSSISSCFGGGMWFNDRVWNNNDPWKN